MSDSTNIIDLAASATNNPPQTVAIKPSTTFEPHGPLPQYVGIAPGSVLNMRIENLADSFSPSGKRTFVIAPGQDVHISLGRNIEFSGPQKPLHLGETDIDLTDAKGHCAYLRLLGTNFITEVSNEPVSPFPAGAPTQGPRRR